MQPARVFQRFYCEIGGIEVDVQPVDLGAEGLFVRTADPRELHSTAAVFIRSESEARTLEIEVAQVVSCEEAVAGNGTPGFFGRFTTLTCANRSFIERRREELSLYLAAPPVRHTLPMGVVVRRAVDGTER
jgi:hypothetical protein